MKGRPIKTATTAVLSHYKTGAQALMKERRSGTATAPWKYVGEDVAGLPQ
jgi:hypothetical protein